MMNYEQINQYVVKLENGAYRIADTRVSLDSVVHLYKRGELPEAIARSFPALSLAQVYGAIAFYLEHQERINEYLRQNEIEFDRQRAAAKAKDPEFHARFAGAREKLRQQRRASINK